MFGSKTELDIKIGQFKQVFNIESSISEISTEAFRDWARLENDYARELLNIHARLNAIPNNFQ